MLSMIPVQPQWLPVEVNQYLIWSESQWVTSQTNTATTSCWLLMWGKNISQPAFEALSQLMPQQSCLLPCAAYQDHWLFKIALPKKIDATLLSDWQERYQIECAQLESLPDLSQPGFVLMDMDSTAIQIECIDEIAKLAGVGDEVAQVTELAMQGELDFEQSLRQRVSKLEGADIQILQAVLDQLPMTQGLAAMVSELKNIGWSVGIASGGFCFFANALKEMLQLDIAQANELEVKEGKLTGQVVGSVVDAQKKADILLQYSQQNAIPKYNQVAIGDGANDLPMLAAANIGVAFHAKAKVRQEAKCAIQFGGLFQLICLLATSQLDEKPWA